MKRKRSRVDKKGFCNCCNQYRPNVTIVYSYWEARDRVRSSSYCKHCIKKYKIDIYE